MKRPSRFTVWLAVGVAYFVVVLGWTCYFVSTHTGGFQ